MKKTQGSIVHSILIGFFCITIFAWVDTAYSEVSEFNKAVNLVRDKDYSSAVIIFRSLAEQDDHQAQYNLALLLKKGLGHPSNYPMALKWAWLSQLSGVSKASDLSAGLISIIPDETQDIIRAEVLEILQKRIEESDRKVILQKAEFHLTVVVEPDYVSAYALRSLGAAIGLKGAIDLRDEIESQIEPEDLMAAQVQAARLFSEFDWSDEGKN
ncbi:hypothetical protein N9E48_01235 [Paracoccaceae bacterium]|nr:hypothetical protein [Paracoccaceae bacterium]